MKLTSEQQQEAIKRLSNFLANDCLCGHKEWLLNDRIFEMREFEKGNIILGGQSSVFPLINVTCKKCGNTHMFSAILLNILDKNDQDGK